MAVRILITALLACGLCVVSTLAQADKGKLPKLTVEEILAKHAASIGNPDAMAAAKTRVLVGVGTFTSKIGYAGKMGGLTQLASTGDDFLLAMKLNSNDYPFEKFGYDGKSVSFAKFPSGGQGVLTSFLIQHGSLIKRGLFGGAYRPSWAAITTDKKLDMEYGGTGSGPEGSYYKIKISGAELDDVNVTLYFDSVSFRHIRTDYSFESSEMLGPNPSRPLGYGGTNMRNTFIERFSNFKRAGDLVIPMTYAINYQGVDTIIDWNINFSDVYLDQPLVDANFKVS